MPKYIDPQTIPVEDLPGVWTPFPEDLSPDEHVAAVEDQAKASMLWSIDHPETILRLMLNETAITRAFEAPLGYDEERQGKWDKSLTAFTFKRAMWVEHIERQPDNLYIVYEVEDLGRWAIEIKPEEIHIGKL